MPRLGMRLFLKDTFSRVEWFGRGPGENYSDRKTGTVTYELYDLEADASESQDLAGEMQQRVATMKKQLEEWQQSVSRSLEGNDY